MFQIAAPQPIETHVLQAQGKRHTSQLWTHFAFSNIFDENGPFLEKVEKCGTAGWA
jgi:hypothetical protein